MRRVLIPAPTTWDHRQLAQCRPDWAGRFEPVFTEIPEHELPYDFDCLAHVQRCVQQHRGIAGTFSSSDYPGAIEAAAIASALGLPGSPPAAVLRAGHKFAARQVGAQVIPQATPAFALINPDAPQPPPFGLPCFIKPVKGAFSMLSAVIADEGGLRSFFARPGVGDYRKYWLAAYRGLLDAWLPGQPDPGHWLAEQLLHGAQYTVEGYVQNGVVRVIGIVETLFHGSTGSFRRFDYPAPLPPEQEHSMHAATTRVVAALGLDHTFFNAEFKVSPRTGQPMLLEVNPRICGQFGDLYAKVDGRNTYSAALELACGELVRWPQRQGDFAVAASVPLRVFSPCVCERSPSHEEIAAVERRYPGTLVWNEVAMGQRLIDFSSEDGASLRYSVINLGAENFQALQEKVDTVCGELGWRFAAI